MLVVASTCTGNAFIFVFVVVNFPSFPPPLEGLGRVYGECPDLFTWGREQCFFVALSSFGWVSCLIVLMSWVQIEKRPGWTVGMSAPDG